MLPEHCALNLAWGQGETPIKEILQLVQKNKWKIPATIEQEYVIPAGVGRGERSHKVRAVLQGDTHVTFYKNTSRNREPGPEVSAPVVFLRAFGLKSVRLMFYNGAARNTPGEKEHHNELLKT